MTTLDDVLGSINQEETVALLRELVRTRSYNPPGEEAAVGELVAQRLRALGLEVATQVVADDRANVIGRLRGSGGRPALLLCAHLDTVPPGERAWTYDPLGAELVNGRLYGRGSLDTKGALAAMMVAAGTLAQAMGPSLRGDLVVLATVDEEVNGQGARAFKANGGMDGIGHLVVGEPTGLDPVIAHRGALWLEITAHGRAAHGSMPHQGINAILPMAAILARLARHQFGFTPHPLLQPPTINIATIQGGLKTNMVPDRCRATVDIRTVPGQSHSLMLHEVRRAVDKVLQEWPGVDVDVAAINDKPPLVTAPEATVVHEALEVARHLWGSVAPPRGVAYLTDGAVLAGDAGIPTLILGPGDEGLAHQVDEYVEVRQVLEAARFYAALAVRLLT
ncbi:MAG: M20 family metallopeptidase [Ardenticatenaceae bacterium]|nr:M20 family metallopeptidase [Ardenticatenaceae bacterium]